jgi:hypothetical protein
MQVRFYHFSKRNKSTKVPTVTYTAVNCFLKEGTSLTAPVILIQTFNAAEYNYCYIPDFRRYYFISNSMYVERMYEVALTEDYLATFKSQIGATYANVMYATGSTKNIADSRIPVKAEVARGHSYNAVSNMTITEGSGAVILGITGKGSFGTYLMQDSTEVSELLDGIDSWSSFITDNWTFTKQLFFGGSASECLKSAIALPLVFGGSDVSSGTAVALSLGNYPCMTSGGSSIKGYKITKPILKYNGIIDIPWQSTDWKRIAQYTDIKLYLPLIGMITIPSTEVMDDSSLTCHYAINVTSGDISVEVYGTSSQIKVAVASGNCAMPTAYGSTGINTSKLTQAAATGVGVMTAIKAASLSAGPLSYAGQVAIGAGIAAAAGQTIDALGGSGQGSGGLGGGSNQGLDKVMHCFVSQKVLTDTQSNLDAIIGKPFMGLARVDSFVGYVQTDGFQFASEGALSSEKDMINKLLDSGIYYE